jgi:choline dehydrogenase-like flavoprotein
VRALRYLRRLPLPGPRQIRRRHQLHPPDPDKGIATYEAHLFCLCAGAINSAVVLLASATDAQPRGLANSSDQVGRNFMYHQADAILALSTQSNPDSYTKTWGTNDFYLKDTDPDYPFPLGQVQPIGSFHHEMMKGDAPPLTPGFILEKMKQHAVPWWLTTEDLPDPENRVTLENATPLSLQVPTPSLAGPHSSDDTDPEGADNQTGTVSVAAPGRIRLSYTPNNVESFERLKDRWLDVLKRAGHADTSVPLHAYFKKRIPLEGVGHQNGTCRMGVDPASSVLDANCKAHDLDNLYVVDASCFVSASAVNPSLTIIANSLRIADHLLSQRLA